MQTWFVTAALLFVWAIPAVPMQNEAAQQAKKETIRVEDKRVQVDSQSLKEPESVGSKMFRKLAAGVNKVVGFAFDWTAKSVDNEDVIDPRQSERAK